jgi:REP element-mobilizing transposase RayT
MALRFEHGGSGPLVQQTWENLHEVRFVIVLTCCHKRLLILNEYLAFLRKLIDDVCAWAHAILVGSANFA